MNVDFFRSPWQASHRQVAMQGQIQQVLASGSYILGNQVAGFEIKLGQWLGRRHVAALNSGTDALVLALRVLGIGPGDEVILPTYTFFACYEAVVRNGAIPVLIDIQENGFLAGPEEVEAAITPRTKAVLTVALFGDTSTLWSILALCQAHNLLMIEDVAQAFGGLALGDDGRLHRAGSLGDASCFSFYPTKNLGGVGDAGAAAFRDSAHRTHTTSLRNHGYSERGHDEAGLNSRMDELHAVFLKAGLDDIEVTLDRRRVIARQYLEALAGVGRVALPDSTTGHAWNYFVIRHPRRDALAEMLSDQKVATRVYYPQAIHQSSGYLALHPPLRLPQAEARTRDSLALPIFPDMTQAEVDWVIEAVIRADCMI